jgi:hypothetical protein
MDSQSGSSPQRLPLFNLRTTIIELMLISNITSGLIFDLLSDMPRVIEWPPATPKGK